MLTFPPDHTFLIQIVLFFVLWIGLKKLLFDPVMALLEAREARTTGAKAAAAQTRSATEMSAAEYEHKMQEARQQASRDAAVVRTATAAEEQRLLETAREEATRHLAVLRENLARQADAARPALDGEVQQLATRMVERIAGRSLA